MRYANASEWPEWTDADVWVPTEDEDYIGPTEDDEQWWQEQTRDEDFDEMADESASLDRYERGLLF